MRRGPGRVAQRGRTMSRYAPELVEGGFAVEVADAPLLHDGLNVADVAHVLVLRERGVIPEDAAEQAARRAPGRGGHAVVGVRLRPRARRGLQLPRAAVRRRDRPRRGLAARRTAAPRGRADRAAAAGAPRRGRPRRGGRRVRGCGRAGRRRAGRDPDGRPDLPAARPAVDVRALPARQRVPGAAHGRPAHRGPRRDQPQPRGRGRGERQPAGRRPRPHRGAARLRRRHRAHPRRHVAERRAHRAGRGRRHARHHPRPARRGPGDLRQRGVRLGGPRRGAHPLVGAHAAEAQPVRA